MVIEVSSGVTAKWWCPCGSGWAPAGHQRGRLAGCVPSAARACTSGSVRLAPLLLHFERVGQSSGHDELPDLSVHQAARLAASTRDYLGRLREVLGIPERGWVVPAHLSFSEVSGAIRGGITLAEMAEAGDADAQARLGRWMARPAELDAAVEALHAAGAIASEVLWAYRGLAEERAALLRGWQMLPRREVAR